MSRQNIRYFLWILVFFLFFLLFFTWENERNLNDNINPDYKNNEFNSYSSTSLLKEDNINDNNDNIFVDTNLISSKINLTTGDIVYLSFKKYKDNLNNNSEFFILFDKSEDKFFLAKTGFYFNNSYLNDIKNMIFLSNKKSYFIYEDSCNLYVNLEYKFSNGIILNKIYTFKTYSYEIEIDFFFRNNTNDFHSLRMYGFIKKKKSSNKNSFFSSGSRTFEGGAIHTLEKPYKKISFDSISNKDFFYVMHAGWISILEQYFLSALFPDCSYDYIYTAEKIDDKFFLFKYISDKEIYILPGECKNFKSKIYVGPKLKKNLCKLYTGFDLSIDYGIFWPIASPLFSLLSNFFNIFNNWGLSIIFVTLMIKLLFFHLSSMSYYSMANMKKLQPRLDLLKERYGDDKKLFGQAVMDLYKKEKVNPLSGCFPILIQIPVFISLYYVILESIELRHASFFLWITDLSSKDPYYVLPILMCITMFLQQKLNPPIQDPLQAKIMNFIPFLFLLIFLQFPSGLILYWIINNILSILQQWFINKNI